MDLYYVTFPDRAAARELARNAIEERVAACANILPIDSIYRWDGDVVEEDEVVALFKTGDGDALEPFLEQHHPYDVPCIMHIPAAANAAYEDWIRDETS